MMSSLGRFAALLVATLGWITSGAEAGNIQSILSQLGLSTHTIQLGEASLIVLQESDDEEVDQILEVLSELESAKPEKITTETTTTTEERTKNE